MALMIMIFYNVSLNYLLIFHICTHYIMFAVKIKFSAFKLFIKILKLKIMLFQNICTQMMTSLMILTYYRVMCYRTYRHYQTSSHSVVCIIS
jgi:hypothetical protein